MNNKGYAAKFSACLSQSAAVGISVYRAEHECLGI